MAELIEPTSSDPQQVVEDVYPIFLPPNIEGPLQEDVRSRGRMASFLRDRLRRDEQPTPGGTLTVVTGEEDYLSLLPRHHETRYYLSDTNDGPTHWRRAAGIFLAANVLLNLVNGNAVSAVKDTIEAAQAVKDTIEDHFGIGDITSVKRVPHRQPTTIEKTETERLEFNSSGEAQPVGEAVADQEVIDKIIESIEARQRAGEVLVSASFSGVSSDDWRRDPVRNGFGHVNAGSDGRSENVGLAQERLELTKQALIEQAAARGIDLSQATFDAHESVLDEEAVLAVENAVMANGFDGYDTVDEAVDAALEIYNTDPESLPESLRDILKDRLPRGFQADLTYQSTEHVPGDDTVTYTHEKVRHHDGRPNNENNDYDLALIPLVLVPWVEFRRKMLKRIDTESIILPPTMPNPEYLRLYPAARTEQDTLVDHAWAYARKYQHLMRETDRVQGMYRLDFEDSAGEPQRLRAIFIDHEPTPEMLERTNRMLQIISQIQGGRVGRELDLIAIYPSDNAGTSHGDPKRVGLGQDIQFEDTTLGVAYPSLRLVEMHMPPEATSEELDGFSSPSWTLAHEVAGHFTDLNEEDNKLNSTGIRLANGAEVFTTNARFEEFMQSEYLQAQAEEQSGRPSRWRVRRRVENTRGEIVDMTHDVVDPARRPSRFRVVNAIRRAIHAVRDEHGGSIAIGDPRLAESISVRKETGHPTRYGATSAAEHQAEAAASELVGEIPFSEAHDGAGIITREDEGFVSGYRISTRDRVALADRWGSDVTRDGVVFTDENGEPVRRSDWVRWYGHPQDDEELAALINEARRTRVPADDEMIHIVTGRRI